MRNEIKELMKSGVYDQHKLFDVLYRRHTIHYAKLRQLIAEVKNG